MRLLLDKHTLLWFGLDDRRLSVTARGLIEDPANEIAISPASYWEIAIKIGLRKYSLAEPFQSFFEQVIAEYGLQILPIEIRHTAVLTTLPSHHRDPFDRLLIAQAIVEGIPVVSDDLQFDAYPITRLW